MLRFEIYQSRDTQWRWRLVARNGRIIADSGESYVTENNAVRAARRTRMLASDAPLVKREGHGWTEI